MAHHGVDPLDDPHDPFMVNYPRTLQTRGTSPYAQNRATTLSGQNPLQQQRRPPIPEEFLMTEPDTDLIDTAIVIKNIPFSYPEEDFTTQLFPQLGLVPPYAFNYHRSRSDRTFHGLAFANFNAPHEAQAAVDALNNFELERRRLRVELKKRLPAEEEQRQRLARQSRRQLTHQSSLPTTFASGQTGLGEAPQTVESMPMASDILDPVLRPRIVPSGPVSTPPTGNSPLIPRTFNKFTDLDMNDPETLGFYTTMQLFRNDPKNQGMTLQFPSTLSPEQRRIVHSLAIRLNLDHTSLGNGLDRYITVTRRASPPPTNPPPPTQDLPLLQHHGRLYSPPSVPEFGYQRPFPTSRASTEHLISSSPSSGPHDTRTSSLVYDTPPLRHSRSTGNLYGEADSRKLGGTKDHAPPVPTIPASFHHFSSQQSLGHRTSHESTVSSQRSQVFGGGGQHGVVGQPTRQPIGPPQEAARGFSDRPSRDFSIRPIGHGAKTSSHGSLSHGTASVGSRGGSDTIMDLQIQSPPPQSASRHDF